MNNQDSHSHCGTDGEQVTLATDYDGTLAHDGVVDADALAPSSGSKMLVAA
jgi:hypothetical protein